jgi:serine phosphatase RsbU (regulator of sigma subunit)
LADAIEAFVAPPDRDVLAQLIDEAITDGVAFTRDLHIRRADGEERIVAVYGAVHDEDPRLWGTGQDVTEQRLADEALRRSAVALAEERASVAMLQTAVLPVLTSIDGTEIAAVYLPAGTEGKVGGDWFDALALPDGRLYLAVGDVAGHGLTAASAMAQARNALRGCAFAGLGPAAVCDVVSGLYRATNPGSFATCLVAVLAADRSSMTWCRAGHPPPARRPPGAPAELLEGDPGPPLGVGDDYRAWDTPVRPGDTIVLYTDGLVERPGEHLDVGFRRLLDAIGGASGGSVDQLCDQLVDALGVATARRDDVCVLAVRTG